MTQNYRRLTISQCETTSRLVRLLRDETGATTLEYVVAAVGIALAGLAASRAIAGVLASYLHRVNLVVTLPVP